MFKLFIHRKITTFMLFSALCMLGYFSYQRLAIELLPNVEFPFLIVSVRNYNYQDARLLEKDVVTRIEGVVSTLEGVNEIESYTSRDGSIICLYYNHGTNLKYSYLKLTQKLKGIKEQLSDDYFINIIKIDTEQFTNIFMELQVLGSGGENRIRNFADQYLAREFENIDGIAKVNVIGGREKSVEITLDSYACKANNISVTQVKDLLYNNLQPTTYVGRVSEKSKWLKVNVLTELNSIEDIRNLVVKKEGPILLRNIAKVNYDLKERDSYCRVDGKNIISILLVRDSKVNLLSLSESTYEVINKLNKKYGSNDIRIKIEKDQAKNIRKNINLIIKLVITGIIISICVLWFFLHNLTLVSLVTLTIPITLLISCNLFYAFNLTINSLTLIGITLAVGMLLDNSIVVMENVYRLAGEDNNFKESVIAGTAEVWKSILASTLTTLCVFLPFIFSQNIYLKTLGKNIGVSIVVTLFISLIVALFLIPAVMDFLFNRNLIHLKRNSPSRLKEGRNFRLFNLLLKTSIRNQVRIIIVTLVLLFLGIYICTAISSNIVKEIETDHLNLYVTMPAGATLESTNDVVGQIEEKISDIDEKEMIISRVFEEEAIITINLIDNYKKLNNNSIEQIKEIILNKTKNFKLADISINKPISNKNFRESSNALSQEQLKRIMGIGTQTEKIIVSGFDLEKMKLVANDIKSNMEKYNYFSSIRSDMPTADPELHLFFYNNMVDRSAINLNSIKNELLNFNGDIFTQLKYQHGTEEYDIVLKNDKDDEQTIEDLHSVSFISPDNTSYYIDQLAQIFFSRGISFFKRVNQQKRIEILYSYSKDIIGSKILLKKAQEEIKYLLSRINIPSDVNVKFQDENEIISKFIFIFIIAIALIYMVLSSVFESLFDSLVIMFTIPLASIGAFWGLILTNTSFLNIQTIIGLLILFGVVVNNGILLIDYTHILQKRGYGRNRALILSSKNRLRPILITSITTISLMVPLAMGKSEYVGNIGAPFAITVIGGLVSGTIFTLIVIPTVFIAFSNVVRWLNQLTIRIKILQLVVFLSGCFLVCSYTDSFITRIFYITCLSGIIPGLTYLVIKSTLRAKYKFGDDLQSRTINIRNLVKIFNRPSRFVREWKKGVAREAERSVNLKSIVHSFSWQLPLLGFLLYFILFYIENLFWIFFLSHVLFFYMMFIVNQAISYIFHNTEQIKLFGFSIFPELLKTIAFWTTPLIFICFYYLKLDNYLLLSLIIIYWYLGLFIYKILKEESDRKSGKNNKVAELLLNIYRGNSNPPFKVLNSISLEMGNGMFGLLGPNGAGKTTLMRIISGIYKQTYGNLTINNLNNNHHREELQGSIGYLPQEFRLYENMTAWEFLDYMSINRNIINKSERESRISYVLEAVHMENNKDRLIKTFSGGMKQRIGIAQILLHLPPILIVDEPTAGLDPKERIRFRNLLVELSKNRIVIFSTHIIEDISNSCNKLAVIKKGHILFIGTPAEMMRVVADKVWQFSIPVDEYKFYRDNFLVISHIKENDEISVRCIAENIPVSNAALITPSLEDAYLYLLKN